MLRICFLWLSFNMSDTPQSIALAPIMKVWRAENATNSHMRPKDAHPFLVTKRISDSTHVRYRSLAKRRTRFEVLCALTNLCLKRRVLIRHCNA